MFHLLTLMKTAFTARRLYTPTEEVLDPLLVVEDGRVARISSRPATSTTDTAVVDFGDATIAPGFLDIHVHGGAGLDVMRASLSELPRFGQFLSAHGVTCYFATTVAAELDATYTALERLADAIEKSTQPNGDKPAARPLGIHLEGPFLSHKRR